MAKDDFTVQIEDGRIMFMTSYRNEFGEECKVADIISKDRIIEIRDNINRALAELSNESGALLIPDVSGSCCPKCKSRWTAQWGRIDHKCSECKHTWST